jgi:hypothetical protein
MGDLRPVLLGLFFMLAFPFAVSAQEYDSSNEEVVVDVMKNTSNQFVYAFFGKDLLLYYLNDDRHIQAVSETNDDRLSNLSRPFNSNIGQVFMGGLTLIYFLVIGYCIVRLVLVLFEAGWLMQSDGGKLMDVKERRGLMFKLTIVIGLVATPIPMKNALVDDYFYTNPMTVLLFDLMGRVNTYSDEAVVDVIKGQRQALKTLSMPAASSKSNSMQELNRFYTCARSSTGRDRESEYTQSVDFMYTNPNNVAGVLQVGLCILKINFGLDIYSDVKMQRIIKNKPELGFEKGLFIKAQKAVFIELLENASTQSYAISEVLSLPHLSSNFLSGDFSFRDHTSLELSIPELRRWGERCDEVMSWSPRDNITRQDRYYFNHLSARCMARDVAQKMVYPASYDAMGSVIGNGVRDQKSLALCVNQAEVAQMLGDTVRFSAVYGGLQPQSQTIEEISVEACVTNICAANSLRNGGLYACTNALDLYESRLRDEQIQDRGTMMLGFYMFDLFLYKPPSAESKNIFNAFNMSFYNGTAFDAETDPSQGVFMTTRFRIPAYERNADYYIIKNDIKKPRPDKRLPTIYEPIESKSFIPDLVGINRLQTCVKSPLQIHSGYVCGNVPQEFSQFGMNLLKNLVALRTILIAGQTAGQLRYLKKSSGSALMQANQMLTPLQLGFAALGTGGISVLSDIVNFNFLTTDEFGYLNSQRVDSVTQMPLVALLAATSFATSSSSLWSIVDAVLTAGLLVSIVFAFLIPLFPMLLIIRALIKYLYLLFITIIMSGFKIVDAGLERDGDLLSENMDRVWADWLALILKLPLTVIGIMLAWLMSNVIISHVMGNMIISVPTNDGSEGVFDLIILTVVSLTVVIIVYNTVLSIVESFYDFTVEWILGTMHESPFGKDSRAFQMQDAKEVLGFMGR